MNDDFTAVASATINAPAEVVWNDFLNPEAVQLFMFGATVRSDWHEGHPITWSGTWQGKRFEDRGTILRVKPLRLLKFTHFSALSDKPDRPENHHVVTIELTARDGTTDVTITQERNDSREAKTRSEQNWGRMLGSLKALLDPGSEGLHAMVD
jgi:uncharacterized protein YndB with AHSA1/START domain